MPPKDIDGLSPGAKFILYEEVAARFPQYLSSKMHSKDKVSLKNLFFGSNSLNSIVIIGCEYSKIALSCLKICSCFYEDCNQNFKDF